MISLFNRARIVENCQAVARHAPPEGSQKIRFAQGLKALMRTPLQIETDLPALTFGRPEWCDFLIRRNVIPQDQRTAAQQIPQSFVDEVRDRYAAMRDLLAEVSQGALLLLDQVTVEIAVFQRPRPEAGSHSSALGFQWINPRDTWSVEYYAEVIFHELLHNVFFLEDMTRTLMRDMELLESQDTRAYSAIRQTTRFYDSAFHALAVSAGMIWFHDRLNQMGRPGHQDKVHAYLKHGQLAAVDLYRVAERQVEAGRPILTPNGESLLAALITFFAMPDVSTITAALAV